jgi:hypothetical protein
VEGRAWRAGAGGGSSLEGWGGGGARGNTGALVGGPWLHSVAFTPPPASPNRPRSATSSATAGCATPAACATSACAATRTSAPRACPPSSAVSRRQRRQRGGGPAHSAASSQLSKAAPLGNRPRCPPTPNPPAAISAAARPSCARPHAMLPALYPPPPPPPQAGNFGGFQTLMRAPAPFAYHIPKGMDPAEAAPLLCAGITVGAGQGGRRRTQGAGGASRCSGGWEAGCAGAACPLGNEIGAPPRPHPPLQPPTPTPPPPPPPPPPHPRCTPRSASTSRGPT